MRRHVVEIDDKGLKNQEKKVMWEQRNEVDEVFLDGGIKLCPTSFKYRFQPEQENKVQKSLNISGKKLYDGKNEPFLMRMWGGSIEQII